METLSERDREILNLKMQGMTDQKIAEKVGFKNHSAVVKRRKQIAEHFQKYVENEWPQFHFSQSHCQDDSGFSFTRKGGISWMNELFNDLPDVLDAKALAHALSISHLLDG